MRELYSKISLIVMAAGLLVMAPAPNWLPSSATPAFAHEGGGGGGEAGGEGGGGSASRLVRPGDAGRRSRTNRGQLELPLPGEVRELGGLIVQGAAALQEANSNIAFLDALEREVENMDDLSDARLNEVMRDIRNARREQEQSRAEIRTNMREAFAAMGVHLGKRGAREALRDLARAMAQAERAANVRAIVKAGRRGLEKADQALQTYRTLKALGSMMNNALNRFKP